MKHSRRDALKKALIAAVAAASPASLLLAAGRVSSLKFGLLDGSDLEFTERQIFILKGKPATRTAVTNGEFRFKGGGRVLIQQGRIKSFDGAGASGVSFVQSPSTEKTVPPTGKTQQVEIGPAMDTDGGSAGHWLLKNKNGDELQFRGR
jgi:hypothetical protein